MFRSFSNTAGLNARMTAKSMQKIVKPASPIKEGEFASRPTRNLETRGSPNFQPNVSKAASSSWNGRDGRSTSGRGPTGKADTLDLKVAPKTWKPSQYKRVAFNLEKLRQLSGSEKMDLLRDYIATKSPEEAIHVYQTLVENGISNRLNYKDHHNLFRLLLKDIVKYRTGIALIRSQMREHNHAPTEYFLNEYTVCCALWGNMEASLASLQELLDADLVVQLNTWNCMFQYYNSQKEVQKWQEGIALWLKLGAVVPIVRPNGSIYLRVMDLYTKLMDLAAVERVYVETEENISRLHALHCRRMEKDEDSEWMQNLSIRFFNARLGAMTSLGQEVEAIEQYKEFRNEGRVIGKDAPTTFYIMLKVAKNVEEGGNYWKDMETLHIEADYLHYSRMIGLTENVARVKELYRLAATTLKLKIGGSKRKALDSSFMSALIKLDLNEAVEQMNRFGDERLLYKLVYLQLKDKAEETQDQSLLSKISKWMKDGNILN